MSKSKAKRTKTLLDLTKTFTSASPPFAPPVLCLGIDVTWWGGSGNRSEQDSRRECIAYSVKSERGWEPPRFSRVDLPEFNPEATETEPNSDPNGKALVAAIFAILDEKKLEQTIVALDAPLKALPKLDLPMRKKSQEAGEVERRGCDRAWANILKQSPDGWRNINVQPGAPVPFRIASIVEQLCASGFNVYDSPKAVTPKRALIECFPNEALWSAGVLGHCDDLSFSAMTAYKQMGKTKTVLPADILREIISYTLKPCLEGASLPVEQWFSAFWEWICQDKRVVVGRKGITGKSFDDAVDSMLSLIAAAAFADGLGHVHLGDSPDDGHIVGPGLFNT